MNEDRPTKVQKIEEISDSLGLYEYKIENKLEPRIIDLGLSEEMASFIKSFDALILALGEKEAEAYDEQVEKEIQEEKLKKSKDR